MHLQQQLTQLKTRRRSVAPNEIHALLAEAGIRSAVRPRRPLVYTHSRLRNPLTIDPRNPLLPVYVSKAIRAIEEVLADEGESDDA